MTGKDLVVASTGTPAVDPWINRMYGQMLEAAAAKDVATLGRGADQLDQLIDRLKFVRVEAGRRAYDLLADETYRYRGETKTRKAVWSDDDGSLRIEPNKVGGGWRRFNYLAILKAVAQKAYGLGSKVISEEGEVVGTVEDVVAELAGCVSFSNVKCDYEKGTGLAKWGIDRSDVGEYEDPRLDVKIQRTREEPQP